MALSPLTLQSRPFVFEPKVVGLYRHLLTTFDEEEHDDAFWNTLFLLRPDVAALKSIFESTDAESLLHAQHQCQRLLLEALARVKSGQASSDEHALDTLTVFFAVVLSKRFTNPSSDVIEVLAGLDHVDTVFFDLVGTLDQAIKDGRSTELRRKAVRTAIAVVAGGYQTALISYFVHRDFFPASMKLLQQLESPLEASEPFVLIGLLANYNKFEMNNQYRARFAEFADEETMEKAIETMSWTSVLLREKYVAIVDDTPAGWSVSNTLSYVGLGRLAGAQPATPALTEEQQKQEFSKQPGNEAATLLTLYDFVLANKTFCQRFVSSQSRREGKQESSLSAFLSLASYLYQSAYRSSRASLYAYLVQLILVNLVEESSIAKILCETSSHVRMCRQKPPFLPVVKGERPYIATIIDLVVDGINHNVRKRLDTKFYRQSIVLLSKIISHLLNSRTKLPYHWSELWRSLLSFVHFLTTYADDLKVLPGSYELAEKLSDLLTMAISSGESFLPDAAAYDDIFYKLVQSGDALVKFRDAYGLAEPSESKPINSLVGVSKHYQTLIETRKGNTTHLTPREVSEIIKQGYDTLSIETKQALDHGDKFREVDHKVELKKMARVAVVDAANLVS